jgi:hypothetical protein
MVNFYRPGCLNGGYMERLFGKISASLVENDQSYPENLADKINDNIGPPEPIALEDVHVRAMYILSDKINSYGGCFPADEHELLGSLLIDSPVLVGHRKDSLPIARNFHAEMVQKNNANWVKVYFYWLKNAEGAESLKNNIDGGIYKECSISFIFSFPECSICGSDIRKCGHRPFQTYETSGGRREAFFNYREIEKVLETSLVYRGSVHDTTLTNELFFSPFAKQPEKSLKKEIAFYKRIWDLTVLNNDSVFLVRPAFESLRVIVDNTGVSPKIFMPDQSEIDSDRIRSYLSAFVLPDGDYILEGRLLGFRGKERQKVSELTRYIEGKSSRVKRIELRICDILDHSDKEIKKAEPIERIKYLSQIYSDNSDVLINTHEVSGDDLTEKVSKISSRYGAEIIDADYGAGYIFTHRKLIQLQNVLGDIVEDSNRYQLNCSLEGSPVSIARKFPCRQKILPGEVIEVEVAGVRRIDDEIFIDHPRYVDSLGCTGLHEDVDYLVSTKPESSREDKYYIHIEGRDLIFKLNSGRQSTCYLIRNYSKNLLDTGRRFIAEKYKSNPSVDNTKSMTGMIIDFHRRGQASFIKLEGPLSGDFVFRPAIIKDRKQFLFYHLNKLHFEDSRDVRG